MTSTDKLKLVLDDLKSRIRVSESKIELNCTQIEAQKFQMDKLTERKDSTDNLKQNHIQFSQTFNDTVKNLHSQMDSHQNEVKTQISLQDEKRNELKQDIDERIRELSAKIDILNKMMDF